MKNEIERIKVALIVGHSRLRQGARNKRFKTTEYEFNKRLVEGINERLQRIIKEKHPNLEVDIYYRKSFIFNPISELVNRIKSCHLAIFFHCNAYEEKEGEEEATGVAMLLADLKASECPTNTDFLNSNRLLQNISELLNIKDRGVKVVNRGERGHKQLWNTDAELSIIAESFFIDNNSDLLSAEDEFYWLVKMYVAFIVDYYRKK